MCVIQKVMECNSRDKVLQKKKNLSAKEELNHTNNKNTNK